MDGAENPRLEGPLDVPLDPRRWLTLAVVLLTVVVVALDTTILNVSIPTILRDLHTNVPALQWVVTGYSLTYSTLLIIGGRLGDIYGHRRMFIVGLTLFGIGSFVASIATSVGTLILGEAIIEGIGASLMMPSTLAILSTTFTGRERPKAFAIWGATAGAAVAFGPVLGGYLTTNYSWRWSFRINVFIAPIAAIAAIVLMRRGTRRARTRIDLPGAAFIAISMFLLVFALSNGGTYGWFKPLERVNVLGHEIWSSGAPISIVPVAIVIAAAAILAFIRVEQSKARRERDPLFHFAMFEVKSFRYGMLTLVILSMGQLALLFALPLFLQDAVHLSAQQNGLWLLPFGLAVVIGSQIGARLVHRFSVGGVIGTGLGLEAISLLMIVWAIEPGITFWSVLPGLAFFGTGLGLASSQLTSVVLSEVEAARSGVASGAATTARTIGGAFGIAIVGSLITVQATNRAVAAFNRSSLSSAARDASIASVRQIGPSARPGATMSAADARLFDRIMADSLATGARIALIFATVLVFCGALVSLLIPRTHPVPKTTEKQLVDAFEAFEPLDVDTATL